MKSTSQSVVEPGGAPTAEDTRRNIVGLDQAALSRELSALGIPKGELRMRTAQIWHWVYHRGATSFADMSTIAKTTQAQLTEHFRIDRPKIVERLISEDGTRKYLLRFDDGTEAETVFIPDAERGTLCVSSQVGCTLNCTFCHTGTQRWVRNLTAGEIVGQLMLARDDLGEWPSSRQPRRLSSVVLMGMGEPLYNFDNVKTAIGIMTDGEGIQISRRRITLSTAGVVPELRRAGDEIGVNLAVSLHAVTDEIRNRLVPLNRKYPIAELLEACQSYPGAGNARRITFEYALLKGVNDSDQDAKRLVALIHRYKLPAKVNLIPFNPWPGAPYECSDWDRIQAFSKIIYKSGISAPIRMPRGRDIMAACGQLKSDSVRTRASGSGPKAKVQVTEPG